MEHCGKRKCVLFSMGPFDTVLGLALPAAALNFSMFSPLHNFALKIINFLAFVFSFKDLKLTDKLWQKHGDNLEEKSLTICSGTDYINVNYQHVVCPDAATAKVSNERLLKAFVLKISFDYKAFCWKFFQENIGKFMLQKFDDDSAEIRTFELSFQGFLSEFELGEIEK